MQGDLSPLFYYLFMIQEAYLKEILEPVIRDNQLLLVNVHVTQQNKITVIIDSIRGVTIDDCALVNRYLEEHLDRNQEDFSLEVSSPGADQPLKLREQYIKNRGRRMQIDLHTGKRLIGILQEVHEKGIVLSIDIAAARRKKSAETESDLTPIGWEEIKQGKVIITF